MNNNLSPHSESSNNAACLKMVQPYQNMQRYVCIYWYMSLCGDLRKQWKL